ncbi:hypothetical protein [Mucilaginibacter antarcticus]
MRYFVVKLTMTKAYYFPTVRAIITGILLLLIGLSPIYGVMLIDHSVTAGIVFFVQGFFRFPEIILVIIFLVMIISGILYLINARKILRLKLEETGVYYMPFAESAPAKYKPIFNMFFLKERLKFIPYSDITCADYKVDKRWGDFVSIKLKNGQSVRLLSAPFTMADKKEVVAMINSKTNDRDQLHL